MFPTFVIGLREGIEAALIVGIVAAFLSQEGRRDMLRNVWVGVLLAVLVCFGIGIGLQLLNRELPERGQEMLETVIGLVAVGIVTFMIFWMRRHSRGLKGELEGGAARALAAGSAMALVGMAFFAVLREGIETAVFLVALFQNADDSAAAVVGALLGIMAAVGIGYGIYRGGVRLDLARFFRLTSVVLVFVAAGLLASVAHSAAEVGWLPVAQGQAVDLSWFVVPDTWTSALITGMLGFRPQMSGAQVGVYLAYLVPMLAYVLWPDSRRPAGLRRKQSWSPGPTGIESP